MPCHWVSHSKMNPICIDELFKIKSFKNETVSEIKLAPTQVDEDANLKVNDQT